MVCAENMVAFLKGHFEGDASKYYQVIDEESNAKMRSEKQDAHIIKGCRKFRVIAVDQDGNFVKRLYLQDIDIVENLFKDDENEPTADGGGEDDANDDELYIFGECWALHSDTVFEVVEPYHICSFKESTECNGTILYSGSYQQRRGR